MVFGSETPQLEQKEVAKQPVLLRYRSSTWFIVITICVAIFTDNFIYSVVVPVFPFSLTERIGLPEDRVQYWTSILLSTFGVANLVVSLFCGWLADRIVSRQISLLIGILFQLVATIIFSVAFDVYWLVVSRALQGIAAANVYCVGLALLVDTVDHAKIGQMMGFVLLSESLGIMLGSVLGGVVYPWGEYPGVTAMMLGCTTLDLLLRLAMVEQKRAAKWTDSRGPVSLHCQPSLGDLRRKEPQGIIDRTNTSTIANESPISSQTGRNRQLSNSKTRMSALAGRMPSTFFLLKSPRVITDVYGIFVCYVLLCCFDSVLPLFVKRTFGWDSTGAGLIFLAVTVPALAAPLAGLLSDKYGPRWIAASSFFLMAGFLILLRLITQATLAHVVLLCGLVTLIGFCLTTALSPLAGDLTSVVQKMGDEHPKRFGRMGAYGQAFGLFNCALAGGMVTGPLWTTFAQLAAGWGALTWKLGLFSALAALPVVFFTGGSILDRPTEPALEESD